MLLCFMFCFVLNFFPESINLYCDWTVRTLMGSAPYIREEGRSVKEWTQSRRKADENQTLQLQDKFQQR